jgi:membrane fusion protein, multidrug efflux system
MKAQDEKLDPQSITPPPQRAQDGHTTLLTADPAIAPPSTAVPPPSDRTRKRGRRRAFLIFFFVLIVLGTAAVLYWMHARQFESTDDAQVEMHLNPIGARIDGTIVSVYVEENRRVKVGDPLAQLDPRDLEVKLDQAQAQLSQARSMVTAQQPNVPITEVENATNVSAAEATVSSAEAALGAAEHDRDSSEARLMESEANSARAQADRARYQILIKNQEVSQQEYDQILATAKAQAATVAANRASVASAGQIVDQKRAQLVEAQSRLAQYRRTAPQQVAIRQANVRSQQANQQNAQAQVEQARLNLSYTKILAPVAGIVLKRSAEVGDHVAAGQQLFVIAQTGDIWVTANFKETQLRQIRPGQSASIHVDALNQDFTGYVENIGGGTGAISSVLPPENATGNYVKVVQRIPVRIRFKPNQPGLDRLRAGMSVEPEVRVGG